MLPEDELAEQLSESQVQSYKLNLARLCEIIEMALSGMKHYQEGFAAQHFISSCQNAESFFDNITPKQIQQGIKIINHWATLAQEKTVAATPQRAIDDAKKNTHATKRALQQLLRGKMTPAGLVQDLLNLKIIEDDHIVKETLEEELLAYFNSLACVTGYIEKLESAQRRLSQCQNLPLFEEAAALIDTLINSNLTLAGAIHDATLDQITQTIDFVNHRWYNFEKSFSALKEKKINEQLEMTEAEQASYFEEKQLLLMQMQQPHSMVAKLLSECESNVTAIDEFLLITHSFRHPNPIRETTKFRDYLTQLQQELQKLTAATYSSEQSDKIFALLKQIEFEADSIDFATTSALSETIYEQLTNCLNDIRDQLTGLNELKIHKNGFHYDDNESVLQRKAKEMLVKELKGKAKKVHGLLRNCEKKLPSELCPLRNFTDYDLNRRTAHYAVATNKRCALGSIAALLTESADKNLARLVCEDKIFLGAEITPANSVFISEINNTLTIKIIGSEVNHLDGCKQIIERLKNTLTWSQVKKRGHLDKIWQILNYRDPYNNINRDNFDALVQQCPEKAELFTEHAADYQKLTNLLADIEKLIQTRLFESRLVCYLGEDKESGNADNCLFDYCQWIIGRHQQQRSISQQALELLDNLMLWIIKPVAITLGELAATANTIIYGAGNQRQRDVVHAHYRAFRQQQKAAGIEASIHDFCLTPHMQNIYAGADTENVNLRLNLLPQTLFTTLDRATICCDFIDVYRALAHRIPRGLTTERQLRHPKQAHLIEKVRLLSQASSTLFANNIHLGSVARLATKTLAHVSLRSAKRHAAKNNDPIANNDKEEYPLDALVDIPAPVAANPHHLANGQVSAEPAASSSDEESNPLEPYYQSNPDCVLDPHKLLALLTQFRDGLHELLPETMAEFCPKPGHSVFTRRKGLV